MTTTFGAFQRAFLLALACCLSVARAQDSDETWSARDKIPYEEFYLMGHRGMGEEAPESTIESFRQAWGMGLIPEADIRTTKDGVVVSFHDENFARIVPDASDEFKRRGVQDVTFEELLTFDVGAYKGERFKGQRAVAMTDIVKALKEDPKRFVILDLKNVDLEKFAASVEEVWPQIYLASPDYNTLKLWKKLAPTSKTRLWTQRAWPDRPEELEKHFNMIRDANFDAIDVYEIHAKFNDRREMIAPPEALFREIARETRKRGVLFEVMPLTCGDQVFPYRVLIEKGATALSTDYPTPAARAVKEYYQDRR